MTQSRSRMENLNARWKSHLAVKTDTTNISFNGESLTVSVGGSYLFIRPKQKKYENIHDYWKGLVLEIKTYPKKEALVKVAWYWSKKDILHKLESEKVEIDEELSLILEAMGDMELCSTRSNYGVINSVSSIESDISVEYLGNNVDQVPIVDYFFRFLWNEEELNFQGFSTSCGSDGCKNIWKPDHEEQRYCFTCRNWYHVPCLSSAVSIAQEAVLNENVIDDCPLILAETAHQPAARGGLLHFVAGNIRIVSKARDLFDNRNERAKFIQGNDWDEERWTNELECFFGLEENDRGNPEREQLVVRSQSIYNCPKCGGFL